MTYCEVCKTGEREVNQDSVLSLERGGDYCFVVADGLGAHGKGEEASRIVTEVFAREFEKSPVSNSEFLAGAFEAAQATILQTQQNAAEMKTTAVVLSVIGGKYSWGHVGDSRLYYFRKAKLKGQTADHSVPQMLVYSGEIKPHEIRNHPDRNKLLKAMGDDRVGQLYELSKEKKLSKKEAFLLCTDGFWEYITDDEITQSLKASENADQWLTAMLNIVESTGKDKEMDNYSAIAIMR